MPNRNRIDHESYAPTQLTLVHVPACKLLEPDFARFCNDCGVDTRAINEFYMLRDQVWPASVPGGLCIGCVENRIGRKLTAADFTDAPCNRWKPHSPRLLARLQAASDPRPRPAER